MDQAGHFPPGGTLLLGLHFACIVLNGIALYECS